MNIERIDFSKVYKIEAVPSKTHEELAKKGLGKYPGTMQTISVVWDDNLRKYVNTGLDEFAPEVLRIPDTTKRKEVQEWIKKTKEEIETRMGRPDYLSTTSDVWTSDLCVVHIEVGQDLKIRVNDNSTNELNPAQSYRDAIALLILMNSPKFPKSKEDLSNQGYRDARFYITTSEEISHGVKTTTQKIKKVWVALSDLFDNSKNKTKAREIAFFLGITGREEVDIDVLEEKMTQVVTTDKTGKMRDVFLEAVEMDNTTLAIHNLFKDGLNYRMITMSPDGYYHRGTVNYRQTKDASIEYLLTSGMELELAELKNDVEKAKKKHRVKV
jgi:hypothetical protein